MVTVLYRDRRLQLQLKDMGLLLTLALVLPALPGPARSPALALVLPALPGPTWRRGPPALRGAGARALHVLGASGHVGLGMDGGRQIGGTVQAHGPRPPCLPQINPRR